MDNDPEFYLAEDGAPRSARFGDIYYSLQDGLDESRAVFLTGCRLPEAWSGRTDFTAMELGFGTGLNIAALLQLWAQTRPAGGHLHIFSLEGFLMPGEAAARALAAWPELAPFADAILAQWPKVRRGFHYMDFPEWGATLTLAVMDVEAALSAWAGSADAVFLDGFSPALNPGMWSGAVLQLVAQKSRPGARLATFTVAGAVRRGLQAVGFAVEKCPGFGRKRERLEGVFTGGGDRITPRARPQKVAVIGAGIAGCALVYQARLMGLDVDIFDGTGIGSGASGNVAALVTPRLDAGDNDISALFADAFTYARELYRRLCPQAILGQGVYQCEGTPRDASRFARIVTQSCFAEGDLALFAPGDYSEVPLAAGVRLDTTLWVRPEAVLNALLHNLSPVTEKLVEWRHVDDRVSLTMASGHVYGGYDAVIVACGDGIFDLHDYRARYDLRPVRGQVEQATIGDRPETALSWGGYAVPLADGFIFGATHEREDRGHEARAADRARNLESLGKVMPERAAALTDAVLTSRASIRVMTRDYLPMVGEAAPGVYLMTGLGARGFCLAPLLARSVIGDILQAGAPLPRVAKNLLNLSRLTQD